MDEQPLIVRDKYTLGGIPIFYGTRVPANNLIEYLTAGKTIDDFLGDFPSVKREQVVQYLKLAGALAAAKSQAIT
jgi:uncharacterized protein (DUF433 family)